MRPPGTSLLGRARHHPEAVEQPGQQQPVGSAQEAAQQGQPGRARLREAVAQAQRPGQGERAGRERRAAGHRPDARGLAARAVDRHAQPHARGQPVGGRGGGQADGGGAGLAGVAQGHGADGAGRDAEERAAAAVTVPSREVALVQRGREAAHQAAQAHAHRRGPAVGALERGEVLGDRGRGHAAQRAGQGERGIEAPGAVAGDQGRAHPQRAAGDRACDGDGVVLGRGPEEARQHEAARALEGGAEQGAALALALAGGRDAAGAVERGGEQQAVPRPQRAADRGEAARARHGEALAQPQRAAPARCAPPR
jgi:hypothetical protein